MLGNFSNLCIPTDVQIMLNLLNFSPQGEENSP